MSVPQLLNHFGDGIGANADSDAARAMQQADMEDEMLLRRQLDNCRKRFMAEAEPEVVVAMLRADMELAASGIAKRALKAGDLAPDFCLPDARGGAVSSSAQLKRRPAVISFYRGDWCPYCNLELQALAERRVEIESLDATPIAISPQKHDPSPVGGDHAKPAFAMLSDHGSKIGRAYGVAFEVPASLRPIYDRFGHSLPVVNGAKDWFLPLPATYVVDRQSRIAMSFVDIDYRNRLEPDEVMAALSGLAAWQRD